MDRTFLKHAAVYGVANLMLQAASFILLPVYLRCLSPSEYGLFEIVGRIAETLSTLLLIGGFRQALLTFYQQAETDGEKRRVVSAVYFLVFAVIAVGVLLAALFARPFADALSDENELSSLSLSLAITAILLEPLALVPMALLQSRMESGRYVLVVIGQFVVRVGLCVVLVRFLGLGIAGALGATAATGLLFGAALTWRELRVSAAPIDFGKARAIFRFALPMLPGGVCYFLLNNGDRFFLVAYATKAEIAMYALAYKLSQAVATFSLTPLYMVWCARMYQVAKAPEAPLVFGRVLTRVLAAYLFVGLGLCLFARDAIVLMGGEVYGPAAAFVPVVVLACFFQSASSLMDAGLYVKHRTGAKLGVSVAASVVMFALYALLIPIFRGTGAAYASLGGFAFLALATYVVSQWYFPVVYEWGRLAGLLALAVALLAAAAPAPDGWMGWPFKAGLLILAILVPWWGGLVRPEEKAYVRDLLPYFRPGSSAIALIPRRGQL